MRLEERQEGDVLVIGVLESRLEAQNAEDLKNSVGQRIAEGHVRIAMNLGSVDFMDSAGLGAIVVLLKRVAGKGGLSVCCLTEPVDRVFRLTRLNKAINLFDSEEEAILALG